MLSPPPRLANSRRAGHASPNQTQRSTFISRSEKEPLSPSRPKEEVLLPSLPRKRILAPRLAVPLGREPVLPIASHLEVLFSTREAKSPIRRPASREAAHSGSP